MEKGTLRLPLFCRSCGHVDLSVAKSPYRTYLPSRCGIWSELITVHPEGIVQLRVLASRCTFVAIFAELSAMFGRGTDLLTYWVTSRSAKSDNGIER